MTSPQGTGPDENPDRGQQPGPGPQFYPAPPGWTVPSGSGPPGAGRSQPQQPGWPQAGQPGSYWPGSGYPAQQQPFAAYPGPPVPGQPRKRHRRAPWVVGGAVVLAVILAIATGVVWTSIAPRSPDAAAKRYLTAVSKNDADKAVELLHDPPADRSLLNSKVLHKMNASAPISHIDAHKKGEKSVRVKYRAGHEKASQTFKTTKTSDGWKVTNGLTEVNAGARKVPGLTISGAQVKRQRVFLFPGRYRVGIDSKYLVIRHNSTKIFTDETGSGKKRTIRYELSGEGAQAARQAVVQELSSCFPAKHTFKPGCGAATTGKLRGGGKLEKSSLSWTLEPSEMSQVRNAGFSIHADDGTLASSRSSNRVRWRAECTVDGRHRPCGGNLRIGSPQVDMAAKPLHVTWK